jgi:hypothetical protein
VLGILRLKKKKQKLTDFTGTQCGDGKWNTMWAYEVEHDMGMLCGTHSGNVK